MAAASRRTRLTLALVAAVLAVALALAPMLEGGSVRRGLVLLGALGLVSLLAGVLARRSGPVWFAVLALGAEEIAALVLRHAGLTATSLVYGAVLYLTAELASWSLDLDGGLIEEHERVVMRARELGAIVLGGAGAGALALAAASLPGSRTVAVSAAGSLSACVLALGLAILARGRSRAEARE
jgi:hypothetical protein